MISGKDERWPLRTELMTDYRDTPTLQQG